MTEPDLSEFEAIDRKRTRGRPPCGVAPALDALPKAERATFKAALAKDKAMISNKAIEQWLASRGIECGMQIISAHRRGVCACHE